MGVQPRAYTNGTPYKQDDKEYVLSTLLVHHLTTQKPYQCEYDRVRTLTVHHTNKKRTHQCKYDRVRTQPYTIQTRRQRTNVVNINGTPPNHAKVLSM